MLKSDRRFKNLTSFIAEEIRHTDWIKEFKSVGIFVAIFAVFLALIFFIPPLLVSFGQVLKDSALYDMVSVNLFRPHASFYVGMMVLFTGIFLIIQLGQFIVHRLLWNSFIPKNSLMRSFAYAGAISLLILSTALFTSTQFSTLIGLISVVALVFQFLGKKHS